MKFQFYNELPIEAKNIREKVFVEEQGFKNEFDDIDHQAIHLVAFEDEAIGCARMFPQGEAMILGRIAIVKKEREKHRGSQILQALEHKAKELGYQEVVLSAQVQAKNFYIKNGYKEYGEIYFDESCPHIHMKKGIE